MKPSHGHLLLQGRDGDIAIVGPERQWTYAQLRAEVKRVGDDSTGVFKPTPRVQGIAKLVRLWESQMPTVLLHEHCQEKDESRAQSLSAGLSPETQFALFTSGTTGRAKLAEITCGAMVASADASAANLGWIDNDRWLLNLPLGHIGGLSILVRCFRAGKTVVLPGTATFAPGSFCEALKDYDVTLCSLVPTMLERIVMSNVPPPSSVRAVLVGGAAARAETVTHARNRGWPVLLTYGMTETSSQVATQRPSELPHPPKGAPPLSGVRFQIRDDAVEVKSPTLFSGYAGHSPHVQGTWWRTSDRGSLSEHGRLLIHGRIDRTIVTGGENVDPEEVRSALLEYPGIHGARVFAVHDDEWGQKVACELAGAQLDAEKIKTFLETRLPRHKVPKIYKILVP